MLAAPTMSVSNISPIMMLSSSTEPVTCSACSYSSRFGLFTPMSSDSISLSKYLSMPAVRILCDCSSLNPFERMNILYLGRRCSSNSMAPGINGPFVGMRPRASRQNVSASSWSSTPTTFNG